MLALPSVRTVKPSGTSGLRHGGGGAGVGGATGGGGSGGSEHWQLRCSNHAAGDALMQIAAAGQLQSAHLEPAATVCASAVAIAR